MAIILLSLLFSDNVFMEKNASTYSSSLASHEELFPLYM